MNEVNHPRYWQEPPCATSPEQVHRSEEPRSRRESDVTLASGTRVRFAGEPVNRAAEGVNLVKAPP
jgi:hypothetical protein